MKRILAFSFIVYLVGFTPIFPASLVTSNSSLALASPYGNGDLFSQEQLDNLLAPIALYPDPLLAQVLVAATFPDQIDEAARFLRANADPEAIDYQPWDVSVKAVAHYPTVLYMMADDLDWTATLGQAYAGQSTAVMVAVQRLRGYARSSGSLVSTAQMEVVLDGGYIRLWPVNPRYLYVPVYDPALVFYNRGVYWPRSVISFGIGFTIGSWLNYDCDWHHRRVYYHGWAPRAGWVHRYRPHIHRTNVYVHNRYRDVAVNRPVLNRWVNTKKLNRYNAVHRRVHYNKVRVNRSAGEHRGTRAAIDRDRRGNDKTLDRSRTVDRRDNYNKVRVNRSAGEHRGTRTAIDRDRRVNNKSLNRSRAVDRRGNYNKARVDRPSVERRVKRGAIDNDRRMNNKRVGSNTDRTNRRIESNRGRLQERRVAIGKSVKQERFKNGREVRANKAVTKQVRPQGEKGERSVYRERRTTNNTAARNWRGRSSGEQVKQQVSRQRSLGRSAFASADRGSSARGFQSRGRR